MRSIFKAASRFDSFLTLFVTMPALIVLFNAVIGLHEGKSNATDISAAAINVVEKSTGQYIPYVESVGNTITAGTRSLSGLIGSCLHRGIPVYMQPDSAGNNGCPLKNSFTPVMPVRVYTKY